ncbi:MAG TPA: LacI family DNA-binding transcriptional regulator [Armatimonadota bacterium]|jgi:DNA-binding LacI/PurR family transcriptional regulator
MSSTRNEVAARAGVSTATVSRAYNAPSLVSPEKRARILRAAEALGYHPDRHASALRRKGTGMITVCMPPRATAAARDARIYSWLFFDAVQAVQEELEATMYSVQLATSHGAEELARQLQRHPADGVICGSGTYGPPLPAVLREGSVPYVCCGQTASPSDANLCYIDEYAGGRVAAEACRARGYRCPAHISHQVQADGICRARWEGFRDAFSGTEVPLVDGALGIGGGYASALRLAPRIRAGEIDVIFVVNDLTAVGVMHALSEQGIRIPEQVALLGYDNQPFIQTLPISLATIDLAMDTLYRTAARQLLHIMRHPAPVRAAITPVFVPGDSLPNR